MGITIKEIEVSKLNLQPDERLFVKIDFGNLPKNSGINLNQTLESLKEQFATLLPNSKVLVLGFGNGTKIDLTVMKESEYQKYDHTNSVVNHDQSSS
jgi:hypothetical protein